MKWNWGYGIAALYLGFVIMMLGLVTMSMGRKVDLVTDQYYEEELKFSDKMLKMKRTQSLPEQVEWVVTEKNIEINFPEQADKPTGKIIFYCPANSENDRVVPIDFQENPFVIPASQLNKGRYKMQVDWVSGNEMYWNEGVVVIN